MKNVIKSRIDKRLFKIKDILPTKFYIAGNCLNRSAPKDIDIFPIGGQAFVPRLDKSEYEEISKTKNALTISYKGVIIQFCNYKHKCLKDLVDSFDFAHVQVGALVEQLDSNIVQVSQTYYTKDFTSAKLAENTYYTGSKYPLSSLMRLVKYQERNYFAGKSYMVDIMKIITDIANRGFRDYDDFKDQLDAVDLGLAPSDIEGLSSDSVLGNLFNAFRRDER